MNIHVCLITAARIFESQYGGEGRFTYALANWLYNRGYPVTTIGSTFWSAKAKSMSRAGNAQFNETNTEKRIKKPRAVYPPYSVYVASRFVISFVAVLKMIRMHRANRFEVLHSQDTGYSGLAAIVAGKILNLPVVISSHGIRHLTIASQNKGMHNKLLVQLEYRIDLFCVSKCDGLIVVNPYIKTYYQDRVPKSTYKIKCIPIPIRASKFIFSRVYRNEIRAEFGICDDTLLIGFIGRLVGVKNINSLLTAFSDALKINPAMTLMLVGTGVQERDLRSLAKSKGIEDNVIFTGLRSDVHRILSGLDVFVLPSFTEGLSTSLLEAMASGRPIICSDIPANSVLVKDGENGIIFNPYKPEELKDSILRLAGNKILRIRIGEVATHTALKYDEEMVFPLVEKYYSELLRGG